MKHYSEIIKELIREDLNSNQSKKTKLKMKTGWKIMLIVSIVFLVWTVFIMSHGSDILPKAFELANSPQKIGDIDKDALNFMNMAMLKPLWEGIWVGIFGIFIALGLKKREKYAWKLSLFWGIMLLTNALIQGSYEIIVLNWPNACPQTYMFLSLGLIAFVSSILTRKKFYTLK